MQHGHIGKRIQADKLGRTSPKRTYWEILPKTDTLEHPFQNEQVGAFISKRTYEELQPKRTYWVITLRTAYVGKHVPNGHVGALSQKRAHGGTGSIRTCEYIRICSAKRTYMRTAPERTVWDIPRQEQTY